MPQGRVKRPPAQLCADTAAESVMRWDFLVHTASLGTRWLLLQLLVQVTQLLLQEVDLLLLPINGQVQLLDQIFG